MSEQRISNKLSDAEVSILKAVAKHHTGLLSPADLINGIAGRDEKSVNNLVAKGYLEEVSRDNPGFGAQPTYSINFFRITEKGLIQLAPRREKIWFSMKGDIRTVVVAAITSVVTTAIAFAINIFLSK